MKKLFRHEVSILQFPFLAILSLGIAIVYSKEIFYWIAISFFMPTVIHFYRIYFDPATRYFRLLKSLLVLFLVTPFASHLLMQAPSIFNGLGLSENHAVSEFIHILEVLIAGIPVNKLFVQISLFTLIILCFVADLIINQTKTNDIEIRKSEGYFLKNSELFVDRLRSVWSLTAQRSNRSNYLIDYKTTFSYWQFRDFNTSIIEADIHNAEAISDVLRISGNSLLITGVVGSGKSDLLLNLLDQELVRHKGSSKSPIPIPVNLSSWEHNKNTIEEWFAHEIWRVYGLQYDVAKNWVSNRFVYPLLDGLDEVSARNRERCLSEIGDYVSKIGVLPVVMTCRSPGIDTEIPSEVCRGELRVLPLSNEQQAEILKKIDEDTSGFAKALDSDSVLRELLRTPLMMKIAIDIYLADSSAFNTGLNQKAGLLTKYIDYMFSDNSSDNIKSKIRRTPKNISLKALQWLSSTMIEHNQKIFLIEELNFGSLRNKYLSDKLTYIANSILFVSIYLLTFSIIGTILLQWTSMWPLVLSEIKIVGYTYVLLKLILAFLTPLLITLVFYRAFRNNMVTPVESISWRLDHIKSNWIKAVLIGVVVGFLCGIVVLVHKFYVAALMFRAIELMTSIVPEWEPLNNIWFSMNKEILEVGFYFSIAGAIVGLLVSGLKSGAALNRSIPQEGIKRSGRLSLYMFLGSLVVLTVSFVLGGTNYILVSWLKEIDVSMLEFFTQLESSDRESFLEEHEILFATLSHHLNSSFLISIDLSMLIAIYFGGAYYAYHNLVKIALKYFHKIPFRINRFMSELCNRGILYRVGPGYSFTHQELLEYFIEERKEISIV